MSSPTVNAFLGLLIAAADDAAINGELTQFQIQFMPEGGKELKIVRMTVAPEIAADKITPPGEQFTDELLRSMNLAITKGKLSQITTRFTAKGQTMPSLFRVIIAPEDMRFTWPKVAPAGSPRG